MASCAQPRGREASSGRPLSLVRLCAQRGRRGGRGCGAQPFSRLLRCLLVLRCSLCVPDRPAQHRSQGRAHPGRRPHHPGRSASGRWPRLVPLPKQQAGSNKLEGYERVPARRGATGSSALGSDVCQRPERAGGPPRQPFPAPRHPSTGQRRLRSRPPRDRHVTWGPEHCCVRCLGRVSAGPSASGLVLSLKRERFWKM